MRKSLLYFLWALLLVLISPLLYGIGSSAEGTDCASWIEGAGPVQACQYAALGFRWEVIGILALPFAIATYVCIWVMISKKRKENCKKSLQPNSD
jgi:hypothetical protein